MKHLQLLFIAILAVVVVVLGALLWRAEHTGAEPSPNAAAILSPDDEVAVRGLVSGFADTWNRHDMQEMHDLDTEDVEWINVAGNHWRGKATVLKGHTAIHRTIYAESPMGVEKVAVRWLAPDVAVAVATMKFAPNGVIDGKVLPEIRTQGSFIGVKRDGVWKIAHFHNTPIHEEHFKNDPATWEETGFVPGRKEEGDTQEQEVRKTDLAEAAAVLAGDVPTIEKLWADDFTVNAPNNQILKGKKDAIQLVKDGILDYASFERAVEAVLVHGDTVTIMGKETVKPKGKAPFADQTVRRRFTNIWMKRDGQWQLTARQATIISKE